MLGNSKLDKVLGFIVVMTLIGCVFFVEMPARNVEVVTTISSDIFQSK